MKYLMVFFLFLPGCSLLEKVGDAGMVYSAWEYRSDHDRELYIEGNYKAWGE